MPLCRNMLWSLLALCSTCRKMLGKQAAVSHIPFPTLGIPAADNAKCQSTADLVLVLHFVLYRSSTAHNPQPHASQSFFHHHTSQLDNRHSSYFNTPSSLLVDSMLTSRPYKCSICALSFGRSEHLHRHVTLRTNNAAPNVKPRPLTFCRYWRETISMPLWRGLLSQVWNPSN